MGGSSATTQTDSSGGYQFSGLAFGTYSVYVMPPAGMSATNASGTSVSLTAAQPAADVDAGFASTAPTFTQTPNQTSHEGDAVSLQVSATLAGGGTVNYTAASLPAGLTMSMTSGLISGTVATGDASTTPYSITVTATGGGASSSAASTSFNWTVSAAVRGGPEIYTGPANGDWATGANWMSGVAPDATSDVIFDGAVDNADCIFSQAVAGLAANSVTFRNGYSGTLHLQQSYGAWGVGAGGINQSSGDIEQETGQDINVGGNYNWSGGGVDVVSPFVANINLYTAGTNMNITGNETTGANLVIKAGCTITMTDRNGTTTFKNGAGISIAATANFNWSDGRIANIAKVGTPIGVISNAGTFQKTVGTAPGVDTELPIQNSNIFQLQANTLTITGKDSNGHGYSQTAGSTDLWNATMLASLSDVYINGGNFWTEGAQATIGADVKFNAGTINLNHNNPAATGLLWVVGNVNIEGTTEWDCKVNCAAGATDIDQIRASKFITIEDTPVFKAQGINASTGVPAGVKWTFLAAPNSLILGTFPIDNWYLNFPGGAAGLWTHGVALGAKGWFLQS